MKILVKIVALSLLLISCDLSGSVPQTESLSDGFQVIPNEASSLSNSLIDSTLETRAAANSIGTGPYSKALIPLSASFNYLKMSISLPSIDPLALLEDAKRYCRIKKINSSVSNTVSNISRQVPYIYTGYDSGLDIGILYNIPIIDQDCNKVPFPESYDNPEKWLVFSNSKDGNKGLVSFPSNSSDSVTLEFWFQKVTGQNNNQETYYAIKIDKSGQSAVQARFISPSNASLIKGNLKRVISLAQQGGFQRLYGKPNLPMNISSIQIGTLKSSYGLTQWRLLVPNPLVSSSQNYGSGYNPIPSNSLPTTGNLSALTSVITNDPQNFSQTAGVTTSTNALGATIKLLPESAIDGLVSPFKMISPLQSNGVYPVVNYSVSNSGRAALNFKIGNVPAWIVTDPTQIGKVPAAGANAVKFQVKSGASGCPKTPFTGLARPLYRLFDLQDTKVLPTSTNDPSMASSQTVAAEPKDAILDGSNLDRTATFHTLAVCATAELANFDTSAITWTPGVGGAEKTLTFKNGGGPQKSELEAIKKFVGSTENAFTPAEITQIKGFTDLDYELTVTTIGANPGGSTLTATVNGKTTGLLAAKDTATIKLTAVCKGAGNPKFQVKLNAKNEPDPDMRVKTVDVTLTCTPAKPKPVITPPSGLTITAPVGSSASGSFTLENAGDVDSTLDYIVYRPGQTASVQVAASTPISTRALPPGYGFPSPIGSVDARFTSPSETTGSLLKTSATTTASTSIPVSASCSSVGSFSSTIEVTYATGDFTASGTLVFASSDVTVNVTCTGAVYSGDQGGSTINLTAKVGETATSSTIGYSNTGIGSSSDPATLTTSITTNASWLTVTPSSSSVAPGNGSSFVITASCVGLAAGVYSGVVTLSTNTGKTFTWTVNLTCTGTPKIAVNPTSLNLKTKVNLSVSSSFVVQNNGDANLSASIDNGEWTTASPNFLSGANEVAPHSSQVINVTAWCGSVIETRTDNIRITSNDPNQRILDIPITITCTDIVLSSPNSIKFASSNPSWSGPGNAIVPIQNLSQEPATYTATLNGMPRVNIVGGATGTIAANGVAQIDLEAICPESTIFPAGGVSGILDILVDGVVKTSVAISHSCEGVTLAAIVSLTNLDCGVSASVSTGIPHLELGWFGLGNGYSNLITVRGSCLDHNVELPEAIARGKADADAHLFVPAEQWESPCRNAYAIQDPILPCRRETWASAKARLTALGFQ